MGRFIEYTMRQGKHKGRPLERVPFNYLEWLLQNVPDLPETERKVIEQAHFQSKTYWEEWKKKNPANSSLRRTEEETIEELNSLPRDVTPDEIVKRKLDVTLDQAELW